MKLNKNLYVNNALLAIDIGTTGRQNYNNSSLEQITASEIKSLYLNDRPKDDLQKRYFL